MASLNRPLTEDEARKMLEEWRLGYPKLRTLYDMIEAAHENPTPHLVKYSPKRGVTYVSPQEFSCYGYDYVPSPSDCEWIVPGTHVREEKL